MRNRASIKTPLHPGEILLEEVIRPLKLSVAAFAKEIGVPRERLNEIVRQRRSITADIALRLEKRLGTSAKMWMGLQADYDLCVARTTAPAPDHSPGEAAPRR